MAIIQQINVPLISVNDTSLTVVDILFTHAAHVKKGDIVLVFETSKTMYDVLAEVDGYIEYLCNTELDYEVNELVANIYSAENEVPEKTVTKSPAGKVFSNNYAGTNEAIGTWVGETLFSPAAIELMELRGISRTVFAGKDFVSLDDVMQWGSVKKDLAAQNSKQTLSLPVDLEKVIVEKLSANKKREISYLSAVQSAGLTSTINISVNTNGIFVHLNQSLKYLKNSLLPVIIYESARLLQKYKPLNAYFTGDEIAFYKEVNVGFAIDIDRGLKVVKIANTAAKGMNEIEQDIIELSDKYLDDHLHFSDLADIGFTVTDLSAEGVSFFRPLVNRMNSAILGVSSIDEQLHRCMLSLSFDHRVTEGKLAAGFLQELKERLESYQSKYYPLLNQQISCFKCFKLLQEDLSDTGFVNCITPKGVDGYICQSCFKGF